MILYGQADPAEWLTDEIIEVLAFYSSHIRTDGRTDGRTDRRTDEQMDGRTDGRTNRQTDGQMDRGMDVRTDARKEDRWTEDTSCRDVCSHSKTLSHRLIPQ